MKISYKKRAYKPNDLCHCGAEYRMHSYYGSKCPKDKEKGGSIPEDFHTTRFQWTGRTA